MSLVENMPTSEEWQAAVPMMREIIVQRLMANFYAAYDTERWEVASEMARLIFDAGKMFGEVSDKGKKA